MRRSATRGTCARQAAERAAYVPRVAHAPGRRRSVRRTCHTWHIGQAGGAACEVRATRGTCARRRRHSPIPIARLLADGHKDVDGTLDDSDMPLQDPAIEHGTPIAQVGVFTNGSSEQVGRLAPNFDTIAVKIRLALWDRAVHLLASM